MDVQLLNLYFAQAVSAWGKSKNNHYSDSSKEKYHIQLRSLFEKIKTKDFSLLNDIQKEEIKNILDFFITSLTFLDNSTINSTPFELIECLKAAMEDWIDDADKYIIVTSYNQYSFVSTLVQTKIYPLIKANFDIEFKTKLIQINLPKYLYRDYLTNVVLYHELGHFIDLVLTIYYPIFQKIWDNFKAGNHLAEITNYFPYLENPVLTEDIKQHCLVRHIKEYFADIFACQYVGNNVYRYLTFVASDNDFCESHPSTQKRIEFIDEFVSDEVDHKFVVNTFIDITKKITGKELKKRYTEISSNDILSLLPCEITKREDLHSLYNMAWNVWLNKTDEIKDKNHMCEQLKPGQIYKILNNLIEKSVSNFIVTESWKNNK